METLGAGGHLAWSHLAGSQGSALCCQDCPLQKSSQDLCFKLGVYGEWKPDLGLPTAIQFLVLFYFPIQRHNPRQTAWSLPHDSWPQSMSVCSVSSATPKDQAFPDHSELDGTFPE